MKCLLFIFSAALTAAAIDPVSSVRKFQQIDSSVPTPSAQRLASGAPGSAYWQNRADYDIQVELDDVKRTITAEATVTYHNASPDTLEYLWVQLDQNYLSHNADSRSVPNSKRGVDLTKFSYSALDRLRRRDEDQQAHGCSGRTPAAFHRENNAASGSAEAAGRRGGLRFQNRLELPDQ
jgi:hypothetical protein